MKHSDRIIRTAFAGLFTAGTLAFGAQSLAADNDHSKEEKCAGGPSAKHFLSSALIQDGLEFRAQNH